MRFQLVYRIVGYDLKALSRRPIGMLTNFYSLTWSTDVAYCGIVVVMVVWSQVVVSEWYFSRLLVYNEGRNCCPFTVGAFLTQLSRE